MANDLIDEVLMNLDNETRITEVGEKVVKFANQFPLYKNMEMAV